MAWGKGDHAGQFRMGLTAPSLHFATHFVQVAHGEILRRPAVRGRGVNDAEHINDAEHVTP